MGSNYSDWYRYFVAQGYDHTRAAQSARLNENSPSPYGGGSVASPGTTVPGGTPGYIPIDPNVSLLANALKAPKLPAEADWGRKWLQDLIKQGTPSIPERQIAGLSEQEQQALGVLSQLFSGEYDPRTSPYFQGMREQMKIQEGEDIADIRRGAQLGGALYSTPRTRAEADYRAKSSAASNTILGQLYDQYYNPYSMMQAGTTVGALPRQIAQERTDAQYDQKVSRAMFPYTTFAQMAGSLAHLPFTPVDQTQWTAIVRPEAQKTSTLSGIGGLLGGLGGLVGGIFGSTGIFGGK